MVIRGKVTLSTWNNSLTSFGQKQPVTNLGFHFVCDGSPENKVFWKYTPGGKIELTSLKMDEVAKLFNPQTDYYLDFREAVIENKDVYSEGMIARFLVKTYSVETYNNWSEEVAANYKFRVLKAELPEALASNILGGIIEMCTVNPEVFPNLKVLHQYYVDFVPAKPTPVVSTG